MTALDESIPIQCRAGAWPKLMRLEIPRASEKQVTPSFGVVMPAHNCAETILASAHSVLDNFQENDRLAIVENGSQDLSWEVISRTFGDDPRVRLARMLRGDAAAARNRAIELLPGCAYIAFCDADDSWLPGRLDIVRSVLNKTDADMLFHPATTESQLGIVGDQMATKRLPRYAELLADLTIVGNFIATSTLILRTGRLPLPLFADGLVATQDFEAWCRFASLNPHAHVAYLDEPLCHYRWMGGLSHATWRRAVNVYDIIRAYSRGLPAPERQLARTIAVARLAYQAVRQGKLASLSATLHAPLDHFHFRGPIAQR